jgi:hypothetical protein
VQRAQRHLPLWQAGWDVGLTVFGRNFNRLVVLRWSFRRVLEGTAGSAKRWGLLRGSGAPAGYGCGGGIFPFTARAMLPLVQDM